MLRPTIQQYGTGHGARRGEMHELLPNLPTLEADSGNPPLDRASPLPLYAQIKQRLIGIILRWDRAALRFAWGEQLAALWHVSRDTVRQALSELVHEGLLTRSGGLGTFISEHKLEEHFRPRMDFQGQWEENA